MENFVAHAKMQPYQTVTRSSRFPVTQRPNRSPLKVLPLFLELFQPQEILPKRRKTYIAAVGKAQVGQRLSFPEHARCSLPSCL